MASIAILASCVLPGVSRRGTAFLVTEGVEPGVPAAFGDADTMTPPAVR